LTITIQNKDIPLEDGGKTLALIAQAVEAFGAPIAPEFKAIPISTIADSTFYYGVGAIGLNVASIQGLTKFYEPRTSKTLRFNPNSQVMYFAYPLNYGALTSITDPNGFQIMSDFIHTSCLTEVLLECIIVTNLITLQLKLISI
jgi:hypothetical protein